MMKPLPFVAIVLVMACAQEVERSEPPAGGAGATPPATGAGALPAAIEGLGIRNARMPAANLLTGGQISREQMIALRDMGYRTFVSLRPPDEEGAGWEEEFAAAEKIAFSRIPVAGAAGVDRDHAALLADALAGAGPGPAVLYCASGNRVGALLALKAHMLDGEDAGAALAFGKAAGLTSLEPKVRETLGLAAP